MEEWAALGIDIGGVILDRVSEDGPNARMAAVEGAFDAIARLVGGRVNERVWLVARSDEPFEPLVLTWLDETDFFVLTGVQRQHVHFCRRRADKAMVARLLRITHFIDDRLEVLAHLVGVVPHLYFFRSRAADVEPFVEILPHVHMVARWSEIVESLLDSRAS